MIHNKPIQTVSVADIDERFASGSWETAGGNVQSTLFALTGCSKLPMWAHEIMLQSQTFVDFGCAEGDGTAVLAAVYPMAHVTGLDISPEAVRRAALRWPTLQFRLGDITAPTAKADVIWTSHTLEHVSDPAAAVSCLLTLCRLLVVIVPPINKEQPGPHVGAVPLHVWANQLPKPRSEAKFSTTRRVGNLVVVEQSNMLIWEGTWSAIQR